MALAVFVVCDCVRLVMGAVYIVLSTLGGARSVAGKWDHVCCEIVSSGLGVGVVSIGLSGRFWNDHPWKWRVGSVFAGMAHRS